jgi:O-antigen/teichoic acid export membrane protein
MNGSVGMAIWKRCVNLVPSGDFGRKVLTTAGGTALSQAILAAALPVLTRLYSPEAFGLSALFVAWGSLGAVVVGGRYELCIAVPEEDGEAWAVFRLVTGLCWILGAGALLLLFVWIPRPLLALGACVYLLPLYAGFVTHNLAVGYWLGRIGEFRSLSLLRIAYVLSVVTSQTVFSPFFGATGLIYGLLLGTMIFSVLGHFRTFRTRPAAPCRQETLFGLARRHYRFPLYQVPINWLAGLGWQMPVLMLSHFFGSAAAGYFSLAMRILMIPVDLIGQSICQVFYPEAARLYHQNGECGSFFIRIVVRLFWVGSFCLLLAALVAPWFIVTVMGEPWRDTGRVVQLLAPLLILYFVTGPINVMWIVAGKQSANLIWQVFMVVMVTLGLLAGVFAGDWWVSLMGYGVAISIAYGINLLFCRSLANGRDSTSTNERKILKSGLAKECVLQ